jgi:uncharacterized protein (DUF934 family)
METRPKRLEKTEDTMTRIWNTAGFQDEDTWTVEKEDAPVEAGQKAILPLAAFLEKAAASNEGGLGVLINPADDVSVLEPFLDRIALVAVAFPVFNDGRAFSHATLLATRLNFSGDIRAVGDVLIDQIPLMLRCGVTSFAVTNATALARLGEGRLPGIAHHYQPTALDADKTQSYSWRRTAKPAA